MALLQGGAVDGGDSGAPLFRVGDDRVDVHAGQLAVAQLRLAGDPHVADLVAAGGVDQLRDHVVQRLGLELRQVEQRQVGLLARLDRADQMIEADRLRPAQRGRAQRGEGAERLGLARHRLGQDRRGAGFADHVQVVVAGAAVGANGEVHAGALQRAGRAEAGGELEVGFGAVHHAHAALHAQVDLGLGHLGHVHRDQAVVEQAEAVKPRDRPLAMLFLRLRDFLRGLVQVQVHRHVQLVGQHADALEVRVVDRVRRVRRERGGDQRIVAPLVVDLAGLVEILVVALRPRGGEVDHRQPDARAEAVALVDGGLHVGEEVVLVDAGGAAAEHLRDRQGDAVGDEVRADHRALDRPDVLLQPDLQRQVVGDAAQQRHRVVGVAVDEAGHQRAVRAADGLRRIEPRPRFRARQDGDDGAVADGDGVVLEDHAVWFDRDDEAGFDEDVAGFGGLVGHLFPAFQPAFRQSVGWVGFINPAACTGCWVGEADPAYGLRAACAGCWVGGADPAYGSSSWLAAYLTRETYSPERVSTLITSSWPTNSGTRTTAPVSSVAGLPPPPEVSPRTPGSVSVIFSSTKFGGMTWIGVPFHRVTTPSSSPLGHFPAPPMPALSDWTCSKDSGFMKCQYSPSLYRYCMSVSITSAASIESVAFMVTSCTRPDLIMRYFTRVNAWPLPGLTYSVSTMIAGSPLTRIFIPFLTSFMP